MAQEESEATSAAPQVPTTSGPTEARSSILEKGPVRLAGEYQIRVTGGEASERTLFRLYAEELRHSFRWVIFKFRPGEHQTQNLERDYWAIPIRIELWGQPDDVFHGEGFRTEIEHRPDGRFHIRLAVRLHDRFDEEAFRLEMVRALVLEQMLSPVAESPGGLTKDIIEPPEWIVHGFDQLFAFREAGSPSSFFDGALRSGQFLTPEQLFATEDPRSLDPVSFEIYRASAAAMVEALLDQPNGDAGVREMLADFGTKTDPNLVALLRQHFPSFRELDEGMEKWWALQVAALGQQQSFEFMSPEDTERWLEEAITVRLGGDDAGTSPSLPQRRSFLDRLRNIGPAANRSDPPFSGKIDQFEQFLAHEDLMTALDRCFARIQQLKVAGHPLYRPVFEGYEQVIEQLAKKRTGTLDEQLAALDDLRNTIRSTLEKSEDFLNHYEATRTPRRSQAFEDYIEIRRKLERQAPPRRDDRISRYLDALESEFR